MTVADARGRRFDAITGVGFAVLALVGLVLPGTPPKADDSLIDLAGYFVDHRDDILVGNLLLGLAAALFLWWLGSVRSYLRAGEGGEGRLSAAAFGSGIAGIALLLAGAGLFNGIVFGLVEGELASQAGGDVIRAFFDAGSALIALSAFPFAVFFAAASCSAARSGALPAWAYWSGSVIAVLQTLAGLAIVVEKGFFATGGGMTLIAPLAALLWIVAVSVVMARRGGVPPVARTEP
jgi:hypothetical protein